MFPVSIRIKEPLACAAAVLLFILHNIQSLPHFSLGISSAQLVTYSYAQIGFRVSEFKLSTNAIINIFATCHSHFRCLNVVSPEGGPTETFQHTLL